MDSDFIPETPMEQIYVELAAVERGLVRVVSLVSLIDEDERDELARAIIGYVETPLARLQQDAGLTLEGPEASDQ